MTGGESWKVNRQSAVAMVARNEFALKSPEIARLIAFRGIAGSLSSKTRHCTRPQGLLSPQFALAKAIHPFSGLRTSPLGAHYLYILSDSFL